MRQGTNKGTNSRGERAGRAGSRLPALTVLVANLVAVLAVAMPAVGREHKHEFEDRGAPSELGQPPRTLAGISMDQAIQMAERRYRARVVRADVIDMNGHRVYVLRLLSEQGRVWTVRIDAETGGAM
jgi:uncharacterized membrane protein YkoI